MGRTFQLKGTVVCPGFLGREKVVVFQIGDLSKKLLLRFRSGSAKVLVRVPFGISAVRATARGWLSASVSVDSATEPTFTLRAGDLNGDNRVNTRDVNLMRAALGTADVVADFNGDGVVDQTDFDLLKANLGRIGT